MPLWGWHSDKEHPSYRLAVLENIVKRGENLQMEGKGAVASCGLHRDLLAFM